MSRKPKQTFAAFIEPHLEALHRTAWRLCRNRDDADDLVQDVCLRAHTALQGGERVAAPRAWLLRIQYRLHVDGIRRNARRTTVPYDDEQPQSDAGTGTDTTATAAAASEAFSRLNHAWQALSADQQALLACSAEGYSLAEICEISGLTLTALKARLHRARVRLGRLIEQQTPAAPSAAATGETG